MITFRRLGFIAMKSTQGRYNDAGQSAYETKSLRSLRRCAQLFTIRIPRTSLGLTGNPQVKDALSKVKILIDGNTTLANSKAKIATGSYTPTGAFGASNPSSLTFDFIPKLIWITGYMTADGRIKNIAGYTFVIGTETLTSEYVYGKGFGDTDQSYGKASPNGKTISWYSTSSAINQFNASDYARYFYVAIG